jgi:TolB-like protein/DNA-binding winged helix-turn-helix (wHTH) protein/thioredoxin-like negative regulator of GroEL
LERRGETVTREELRNRLWTADTFVDFDHGLNKAINKIRDTLGDSAASPRFVETVARRGYRFIADVTTVPPGAGAGSTAEESSRANENAPAAPVERAGSADASSSFDATAASTSDTAASSTSEASRWQTVWLGGFLLAVGALALVVWIREFRSASAPLIRSVAVLPLESLSGDESQEYFADGMTDELIATLGQISALRVISRTSVMPYKRARKTLPQIADELNVDAVVEGTVMNAGGRVRITAQLIDARADKHLWSDTYEGDLQDTLTLQNKVARAIASQVQVNINTQEQANLRSTKAVDPDAYDAYLKGRYFWNKRTAEGLQTAREYFDRAIARDPGYAQAYAGLADTYALLGDWQYAAMAASDALPLAKAAAMKAVELNDALGEAHTSLAFCLDGFDWNFDAADREFRRGVELTPGYATAHHWYAWHLILVGRDREAIAEMRRAESLDPLSLIINADLAELLLIAHLPDDSIQQSRRTLELDPRFALAHNQLGQAYLQKGMHDQAIAELTQAMRLSNNSPTCTANLARAYCAAGRTREAEGLLADLKAHSGPGHSNASEIASVYAALGDKDQAMTWLERGSEERFNPGVLIRPGFDPLRSDSRFRALVSHVGLTP